MSKVTFKEFDSISSKAWKQKIQVDLKGADYNESLIWNTNEGIDVKPFYHQDENIPTTPNSSPNQWNIGQVIYVHDAEKSNKNALNAISRGAESIKFIIPNKDVSIEIVLNNINTEVTPIQFELEFLDADFTKKLENKGLLHTDIIGNLSKSGNWYSSLKEDHKALEIIVKNTGTLSVNIDGYQNAGATITQQLAYGMSHLNEYLNHFKDNDIKKVIFNVSTGTNYFFEIAKLRALRVLFNTLITEYNSNAKCIINVTPTKRNKTIYDYNTNMLRTTTECMSAILGGANTIFNLPYDAIYHKSNEFGDRIARNQLLILKNESYFNLVSNASEGSYYIESLTNQLAEKALELFKDIENNGGFLQQLKAGTIQKKIKESADKEQEQFNAGELILLGTNKHPNQKDRMKDDLQLYPFVKQNPRKTLIQPIIEKRLAETIEQTRLKTE